MAPGSKRPPTRAEFERLKAEHERLMRDMEAMHENARQMRLELQTQSMQQDAAAKLAALLGS